VCVCVCVYVQLNKKKCGFVSFNTQLIGCQVVQRKIDNKKVYKKNRTMTDTEGENGLPIIDEQTKQEAVETLEKKRDSVKTRKVLDEVIKKQEPTWNPPPTGSFPIRFDFGSQKPIKTLTFQDILLWRHFYVSLAFFVMIQAVYILLEYYQFTVVTLVGRILQIQVIVCFLYIVGARLIKNASNTVELPFSNFQVTKENLQPYIDSFVDNINALLSKYLDILLCKQPLKTLQFALLIQIVCWLGKKLSGFTFLYITANLALIVPFVYQWKQKEIDELIAIAKREIKKYIDLAISKLPPQVTDTVNNLVKPKSE